MISLSLSSCFEIVEEVNFKDETKGNYQITLNCSQSKDRIRGLMKLDTFMGIKIPGTYEISNQLSKSTEILRKVPGISNVKCTKDFNSYIFTMTFSFDSVEALNKGIVAALANSSSEKHLIPNTTIFVKTENGFERQAIPADSIIKRFSKNKNALNLLKGASFTSIFRFKSAVKTVSNTKSKIAKNTLAVMLKEELIDCILQTQLLYNRILFK